MLCLLDQLEKGIRALGFFFACANKKQVFVWDLLPANDSFLAGNFKEGSKVL